jgi:hypothetical protein
MKQQRIKPVALLYEVRKAVSAILDKPFSERIDHQIFKPDQKILALWAADCAERVLPFFEKAYPKDDRPRKAIEACRTWVRTGVFKMASTSSLMVFLLSRYTFSVTHTISRIVTGSTKSVVPFSLDSLKPEVQDFITGREETWNKTIENIGLFSKYLPRRNVYPIINTVVSKLNIEEIPLLAADKHSFQHPQDISRTYHNSQCC